MNTVILIALAITTAVLMCIKSVDITFSKFKACEYAG